jgi:hypothetical protein
MGELRVARPSGFGVRTPNIWLFRSAVLRSSSPSMIFCTFSKPLRLSAAATAASAAERPWHSVVLGPGQDGKTIQPEGLKASTMNDQRRAMLLDLISEWAGMVHETVAAAGMAEVKAGIGERWFAWSGPTTSTPRRNGTSYYRVHGPNLVIEYAPQRMGGKSSMHIHTIYWDPTNDYGRKFTAK